MIAASGAAAERADTLDPTFYIVWLGQFVSSFGTMLTGFSMGVWLFQRTGSVLDFSAMILFGTVPALLLLPWTGALADRADKRLILLACDLGAALTVGAMALLIWLGEFQVWHLYAAQVVLSVGMAFQGPAAYAAITAMVPKSQFGRASGMFGLSSAVSQLAAPMLAASLLGSIGLAGILALDLASFCVALFSLAAVRLPPSAPRKAAPVLTELADAIDFFVERPSLAMVYGYLSLGGFLSGTVIVLVTPMVLANYDATTLGWINSAGALGGILSGMAVVVWGGPKKWTPLLLGLNLVNGLAVALAGFSTSVPVLCLCSFVVIFSSTMLAACVQSVWRRKVPRQRQGSIAALQQAVALGFIPLSALVGGMLSHLVFEPSLMPGGIWFDSVGAWFGTGGSRGTGLFFFIVGSLSAAISLLAMTSGRLYRLEADVPDAF
jgi:DHA3 family macrolide efflux protein-like MFS transporter